MSLFFFEGKNVWFGILAFTIGNIGYTGALVFYNSYLPEIVKKERFNEVSAQGYAFGYIGSVLLMVVCLAVIANPVTFGFKSDLVVQRASFVAVGAWWLLFGLYSFSGLPPKLQEQTRSGNLLTKGWEMCGGCSKSCPVPVVTFLRFFVSALVSRRLCSWRPPSAKWN
jgi:UMF1 family MFS transporter